MAIVQAIGSRKLTRQANGLITYERAEHDVDPRDTLEETTFRLESDKEHKKWDSLTYEEKNHELFLREKTLLDTYLRTGAISTEQHDKSLHDLTEKMHETQLVY